MNFLELMIPQVNEMNGVPGNSDQVKGDENGNLRRHQIQREIEWKSKNLNRLNTKAFNERTKLHQLIKERNMIESETSEKEVSS